VSVVNALSSTSMSRSAETALSIGCPSRTGKA
jgi:hypothetical protein